MLSYGIGDDNCRAKISGNSICCVLLALRLESFDSDKSHCYYSDDGKKIVQSQSPQIALSIIRMSTLDDASSLKLSDVFDNYGMTSNDGSTYMKPSLRKVCFRAIYQNTWSLYWSLFSCT